MTSSGAVDHGYVTDSYGRSFDRLFQNYWWLRSPDTDRYRFEYAYLVYPSGDVDTSTFNEVYNSYGKDEAALMHQIFIKMVVKIAALDQRHLCVLCPFVW